MKRLSVPLLALVALLDACQNPLNEVDVKFKTPLQAAVDVQFDMPNGLTPANVQIQVAGPDADRVVTQFNTKNFRLNQRGLLRLSTEGASADKPIRFSVIAKADGYAPMVQPIELSAAGSRVISVSLLSRQTSGAVAQATAQSAGALGKALTLNVSGDNALTSTLTIPQGVRLLDAEGQPVTGTLTATFRSLSTGKPAGIPTEGQINGALSVDGKSVIENLKLTQIAGLARFDVYNDKFVSARMASQPMQLVMALNQNLKNPVTGQAVRAGDRIPLFGYNTASGRWQQEEAGTVVKNSAGGLELKGQVRHFAIVAAGFGQATCASGPTIRLTSKVSDDDVPYLVRVVYVDAQGKEQGLATSFTRSLNNGDELPLTNLIKDRQVRVKIYSNPNDLSKNFIESKTLNTCSANGRQGEPSTMDLDLARLLRNLPVILLVEFTGCRRVDTDRLPAQVTAQYRVSGSGAPYQTLATFERRDVKGNQLIATTRQLRRGERYDFRMTVDAPVEDGVIASDNYLIDQTVYRFDLNAGWVSKNNLCR